MIWKTNVLAAVMIGGLASVAVAQSAPSAPRDESVSAQADRPAQPPGERVEVREVRVGEPGNVRVERVEVREAQPGQGQGQRVEVRVGEPKDVLIQRLPPGEGKMEVRPLPRGVVVENRVVERLPDGQGRFAIRLAGQRDANELNLRVARFGGGLDVDVLKVQTEKGAYLGVTSSPPPPVLQQQLGLPKGVGLVVDFVSPDSPAARAGLKQYDLLHKLNDQLLINSQQLSVLVRTFKAGDEVKLIVIRDGKPTTLTAKLIEKEVPPVDRIRQFGIGEGFDQLISPLPPDVVEVLPNPPAAQWKNLVGEQLMMTWTDDKMTMSVTTKDGHRRLEAKDKATGKVIFSGNIDTDEQRNALPKEIKQRLDQVPIFGKPGKLPEPPAAPDAPKPPTAPKAPRPSEEKGTRNRLENEKTPGGPVQFEREKDVSY